MARIATIDQNRARRPLENDTSGVTELRRLKKMWLLGSL